MKLFRKSFTEIMLGGQVMWFLLIRGFWKLTMEVSGLEGLGLEIGVHRYDGKTFTDFKGKEGQQ